jgi:hypothetical protein
LASNLRPPNLIFPSSYDYSISLWCLAFFFTYFTSNPPPNPPQKIPPIGLEKDLRVLCSTGPQVHANFN